MMPLLLLIYVMLLRIYYEITDNHGAVAVFVYLGIFALITSSVINFVNK